MGRVEGGTNWWVVAIYIYIYNIKVMKLDGWPDLVGVLEACRNG